MPSEAPVYKLYRYFQSRRYTVTRRALKLCRCYEAGLAPMITPEYLSSTTLTRAEIAATDEKCDFHNTSPCHHRLGTPHFSVVIQLYCRTNTLDMPLFTRKEKAGQSCIDRREQYRLRLVTLTEPSEA